MPPFARILLQAALGLIRNEGMLLAGAMAYMALLSLFPFIIFLSALMGLLSDTLTVQRILDYFFRLAPPEIVEVLTPVIAEIMHIKEGGLLTLGILGTLWVMVSGMEALRNGLNRAYDVKETRSGLHRRLQSLVLVIALAFALIFAALAIPLGPMLFRALMHLFRLDAAFDATWNLLRYIAALGVLFAASSTIYRYMPNLRQDWRQVMPGALISTALWLGLGSFFSLYLAHAKDYSITYGGLSGVIVTLLFFQLSALFFLFGAEINQAIHDEKH